MSILGIEAPQAAQQPPNGNGQILLTYGARHLAALQAELQKVKGTALGLTDGT